MTLNLIPAYNDDSESASDGNGESDNDAVTLTNVVKMMVTMITTVSVTVIVMLIVAVKLIPI